MNEKMTDEELEQALESMLKGFMQARRKVRAHIAALTAERDAAVKREKTTRESIRETHLDMDNARCPGTNRPIEERIRLLWEERDALHERVQALEAQCRKLAQERDAEWTTRRAAESRLAVIRQPVREAMDLLGESSDNATKAWLLLNAALDDAQPLAPPEAFAHEKGLDAGVFDEAPQPNARVIAYEGGQPIVLATMPPRPEPTTAEAFATVRAELQDEMESPAPPARAVQALSLLECRMGVQEAAIRSTIAAYEDKRAMGKPIRALKSALTDAPPVFTLEEVMGALTEHIGDLHEAVNEVVDRLTALRE